MTTVAETNGYGKLPQSPYLLDRKLIGEIVAALDTVVDRWRRSPAEGQRERGEKIEELLLRLECACTVSDSLGRRWGAVTAPSAPAPPALGPVTKEESGGSGSSKTTDGAASGAVQN